MSNTKPNFAAAFISSAGKNDDPPQAIAVPAIETKTRRVQLLLKPSQYQKLRRIADKQHISVNQVVENLIASVEE